MTDTEVQPAPETGAGNDDVRADVIAAIAQLKGDTEIAPIATPEPAAAGDEGEAAKAERLRNERGQFTKAEGEEPKPEPVSDADPVADKPDSASKPVAPPTSWSADAKAEWSKLSPVLQEAVLKRESEINEGGRRWSEEKRSYDQMLAPVREQARAAGVSEQEGLQRLLSASAYLERDPTNAIRWLAQAYGVDLSKPGETPPARPQVDPATAQLHDKVTGLERMLQQRDYADAQTEIDRFASAPGHEHFEAVKERMGALMASGQAKDLTDAYEQAIWTDPAIRIQLVTAQTAQAEASKRAQEQEAAAKARKAAISVNGSPVGTPVTPKPEYASVRDAVVAAMRQHGYSA